jgi:hypothetical protein
MPEPLTHGTEVVVDEGWRFEESENVAVITLRQIISDGAPILHVTHDSEDGGWQFLGWGDASEEDAKVVALRTIVRLDPSVQELADLPPGWHAWRETVDQPWRRGKK